MKAAASKGSRTSGALEVLAQKGILDQVERVAGTSAGAINAVLMGLGYAPDEMLEILAALDFRQFKDDSFGVLRDSERLLHEFSWYKGDVFHAWISDLIERKAGNPDATFKELQERGGFKDMYFCGTNLSTRFGEVFSFEHTPRTRVADAVRISMSIALFFASIRAARGDVYVDGGVLDNYPVKIFDRVKYIDQADCATHARRPPYYEEHNAQLRIEQRAERQRNVPRVSPASSL